jgi:hypothetical protein
MFYRTPTSVHPSAPIKLSSEILKRSTADIEALKARRIAKADEFRRTMAIQRADIGPSVFHYEQPAEHATLDISYPKVVQNRTIGGDPSLEAQEREDVERALAGEPLAEIHDIQSRLNQIDRESIAIEAAIKIKEAEFRAEFQKLSAAYCAKLKPDHDAKMKQFFKAFGEAYSIFAELQKTKHDLVDSQMGFGGLFGVDLDFLRGDDTRTMFADAKAAGYVASIPESLRT